RLLGHARVVRKGGDPMFGKEPGRLLGALARQTVDDAALTLVLLDEGEKLVLPVLLRRDGEVDVRAVEAEHDLLDLASKNLLRDVGTCRGVRSCRKRDDRN